MTKVHVTKKSKMVMGLVDGIRSGFAYLFFHRASSTRTSLIQPQVLSNIYIYIYVCDDPHGKGCSKNRTMGASGGHHAVMINNRAQSLTLAVMLL